MRLEIHASGPAERQKLIVYDEGIDYSETAVLGMRKQNRHWFHEIDAVLRSTVDSEKPVLSIQVGKTIYSIRYNPKDGQHRALIDFLVQETTKTREAQQP